MSQYSAAGLGSCAGSLLQTAAKTFIGDAAAPTPIWEGSLPYLGYSAAANVSNAALVAMRHGVAGLLSDPGLSPLLCSPLVPSYEFPTRLPATIDL